MRRDHLNNLTAMNIECDLFREIDFTKVLSLNLLTLNRQKFVCKNCVLLYILNQTKGLNNGYYLVYLHIQRFQALYLKCHI